MNYADFEREILNSRLRLCFGKRQSRRWLRCVVEAWHPYCLLLSCRGRWARRAMKRRAWFIYLHKYGMRPPLFWRFRLALVTRTVLWYLRTHKGTLIDIVNGFFNNMKMEAGRGKEV